MSKQLAFYFDSNSCSGCKACEMACRDKHDLPAGIRWRRVYEIAGGEWKQDKGINIPAVIAYNISLSCNHCEDPACVHACPTTAMQKRPDGIVFVDPEKCMGCKYCSWACPYDAPQYDKIAGIMTKCDLCRDYIDKGKEPSCVAACPMRVLGFGELKELKMIHAEEHVYPMPDQSLTKPALAFRKHAHLSKAEKIEFTIVNKEEVA
ncbi:MAG: DMSO/selenate family reductase complex B subunit [Bacteroidota bacterium]|nr:DMSO/selenate family reductase complex B subunit [Bacteroidota bacterium]